MCDHRWLFSAGMSPLKSVIAAIVLVLTIIAGAEAQDNPLGLQQDDPFAQCTSHPASTHFEEPADCQYHGEMFRLCQPGRHKETRCVEDRSKYCTFCSPGISFIVAGNNCTECRPCKECSPNEEVQKLCTVQDDTVCIPRASSTVPPPPPPPGETTCPPCPVTQISLPTEDTTQDLSTSPLPGVTSIFNCTEECENYPNPRPSSSCPHEKSLYIVVGFFILMVLLTVVMMGVVLWIYQDNRELRELYSKNIKKEKEQNTKVAKLEKLLKDNGIDYIEVCNGDPGHPPDMCAGGGGDAGRQGDIEMGRLPPIQNEQDKGAENHHSRAPLIDRDHVGSLNSLDMQPPNSSVTSTPKREGQPRDLGPPSQIGLVGAEVHHAGDPNSTMDYPGRNVNPGFENSIQPGDASTLPCSKSLDHLQRQDSSDSEPTEKDKLLGSTSNGDTQSKPNDKDLTKNASGPDNMKETNPSKASHSRPSELKVDLPPEGDSKSPDGVVGSIATPGGTNIPKPINGPKLGPSPTESEDQTLDKRKGTETPAPNSASGVIPKHSTSSKVPGSGSGDGGKKEPVPDGSKKLKQLVNGAAQNGHVNKAENTATNGVKDQRPSKNKIADSLDFQNIAEQLGDDARRRLYRQIKMYQTAIDQAEHSITSIDFVERTIAVLERWKRREGKDGTVAVLIDAIRKGDKDIADKIEELYS